MSNDEKYDRLYPERAVAPLRVLAEEAVEAYHEAQNEQTLQGFERMAAEAIRWQEALRGLDELGFPPDEPLFLLRGQDELAPEVVRFYIGRAADRFAPIAKHHDHLMDFADRMAAWQPRKLPD